VNDDKSLIRNLLFPSLMIILIPPPSWYLPDPTHEHEVNVVVFIIVRIPPSEIVPKRPPPYCYALQLLNSTLSSSQEEYSLMFKYNPPPD
jgi:hypothetical protein